MRQPPASGSVGMRAEKCEGRGRCRASKRWVIRSSAMRLNHVTLEVADIEASADFYVRLGPTQIVASYPDYARFLAPEGDTTLSLHRAQPAIA